MAVVFSAAFGAGALLCMVPRAWRTRGQRLLAALAAAGGPQRSGWGWTGQFASYRASLWRVSEGLVPAARRLGVGHPGPRLTWSGLALSGEQFASLRLGATLLGTVLGLGLGVMEHSGLGPVLGAVLGGLLGWEAPDLWLNRRLARRRSEIDAEVLYFLDFLALSAQAGLSLPQAVERVAQEFPGILSSAFYQAQLERGLGQWNEDALANLAERLGHRDVTALASALARAGRFGSGTAEVLRELAASIRRQRHEAIREHSNRAGAAVVLPVAVFILPAIVLVIGYPALTMVSGALGGH